LSEFRYRAQRREVVFSKFAELLMNSERDRHLVPQANFVLDEQGKLLVDRIIRFETLNTEFAQVSDRIFGRSIELPHVNKSPERETPFAMDQEFRDAVYRRYERDFDTFQYPSGREYHMVQPAVTGIPEMA
jgi:hypothetical protein